jgi:hypothetical protein
MFEDRSTVQDFADDALLTFDQAINRILFSIAAIASYRLAATIKSLEFLRY